MADEVAAYDLTIIPPPRTILDIGANIGAFSLHYAKKWPAAEISAYEPVKENFERAAGILPAETKIKIFPFAVRNFTGPAKIFLGDMPVTCGFHQRGRQTDKTETVDCIYAATLDSAELVKIDTEGCELEIVEKLDLALTRALVCEYHQTADVAPITAICFKWGLFLLENKPGSPEHGVLKFARPGSGVSLPQRAAGILPADPSSSPRKIFIALPINREITAPTAMCLLRLAAKGIKGTIRFNNGDGVARSRNRLTADFLATDCSHLVFVDSDIIFTREDFERITSHDVGIVGGLYPLRTPNELEWCANGLVPPPPIRPDHLQAVKYIGTGFMCIAREVFERMILKYGPQIEYTSDIASVGAPASGTAPGGTPTFRKEHDLWPMGVYQYPDTTRRYLSEDWYFCQRWLDLGEAVYGDTHCLLQHIGQTSYPLPHQQKAFLDDQAISPSPQRGEGRGEVAVKK